MLKVEKPILIYWNNTIRPQFTCHLTYGIPLGNYFKYLSSENLISTSFKFFMLIVATKYR